MAEVAARADVRRGRWGRGERAATSEHRSTDAVLVGDGSLGLNESSSIAAAFSLFDFDGTGFLDRLKLRSMCEYVGLPASLADVANMIRQEFEGTDAVSLDMFEQWVHRAGGIQSLFGPRRSILSVQRRCGELADPEENMFAIRKAASATGMTENAFEFWKLIGAYIEIAPLRELTDCQRTALGHVRTRARVNHDRALKELRARFQRLGLSENVLWRLLTWIRELVPLLVHINLDNAAAFLMQDTHYRNGFETAMHSNREWSEGGRCGARARRQWEEDLFGGAYTEAAHGERPKYGVLNTMNDPFGVAQCHSIYGDSYLVLRGVRMRVTLASRDSSTLDADGLAVPDYYAHVLLQYNDEELREAARVAKARNIGVCGSSGSLAHGKYKEVQIHGELRLRDHVQRLVAHPRHRLPGAAIGCERLAQVCHRHGWELSWSDEERGRLETEAACHPYHERRKPASKRWRSEV